MNNYLVTKATAEQVTREIQNAVSEIFEKHGLDIPKVKTTYGDIYKIALESTPVELNDSGVNVNSKEAQEWLMIGRYKGFENPAEVLGKIVTINGVKHQLIGYNSRASKMPVVTKANGKTYKNSEIVLNLFKAVSNV